MTQTPGFSLARHWRRLLTATACLLALANVSPLLAVPSNTGQSHRFEIGEKAFLLDGQPLQIRCGEMHYTRVPREYWQHRIEMIKAMGMNAVCVYLFWNYHERAEGEYTWEGQADVVEFCRMAQEAGLWVVLRPGPYSCAEWEMGGLPWWLLKHDDIALRTTDPRYIESVQRYFKEVGEQLGDLQVTRGGPILLVQVENEYGFYGSDASYMGILRESLIEAGFDVPLFACNPPYHLGSGFRDDLFQVVNFGNDPKAAFSALREYQPEGPLMCGEFYPGWFDTWGNPHHVGKPDVYIKDLEYMMDVGASFSIYMAHGGTTFGFWAGADRPFKPDTSSYDYDAPISEAGWTTPHYFKLRELMQRYLPEGEELPQPPAENPVISIPTIHFSKLAPVFDNLSDPVEAVNPLNFEKLDQAKGAVVYRTVLPAGPAFTLKAQAVNDFGWVFLDGDQVGVMDRRSRKFSLELPARDHEATLDILVYAMGRINFGPEVHDRKGLIGPVEAVCPEGTSQAVEGWQQFSLRMDPEMLAELDYVKRSGPASEAGPAFWKAEFELEETGDTFIDMLTWGKGVVWINGHTLGRYWNIGPTQTMYVPGPWLKKGRNEIVVLDLLGPESARTEGLHQPILDHLRPELDFSGPRRPLRDLVLDDTEPVYSGSFSGGSTAESISFEKTFEGRYFCLKTLDAVDNGLTAAIGELDLMDEEGNLISHENWTIAYVSSEERYDIDGTAENAIDGQTSSIWSSYFAHNTPEHPHYIVIDLGGDEEVSGFRYVPAPGESKAGRILHFEVFVGDDLVRDVVQEIPAEVPSDQVWLFTYFLDNGQDGLHLAWSEDGLNWHSLNGGESLLQPMVGESKLMRDPCVAKGPDGTYHMVWTDSWHSRTIGTASTKDFITWSEQQAIPVMEDEPTAINCWAPEIVYDDQRDQYVIFWATTLPERFTETWFNGENHNNHRIYCTTTKDFKTFTPTELFFDPGFNCIDSTLLQRDGKVYMFFKDETHYPAPMKNLRLAVANDLMGPYHTLPGNITPPDSWVEGPTAIEIGDYVYLYFDAYAAHHYAAMRSKDLQEWEDLTDQLSMPEGIRHGSAFPVNREIVQKLSQLSVKSGLNQ